MEVNAIIVDSSVFIAFYSQADAHHDKAVALLKDLGDCMLIVSPFVVQEVSTVLTYRFGLSSGEKFLRSLVSAKNVFVPPLDIFGDIDYYLTVHKKISFTDASLLCLAKRMNVQLLTFDKQMLASFKKK